MTMAADNGFAMPELVALKVRQQAAWSAGDYAVVGPTLQIVGEMLCETLDLHAGERVLDVAAGSGNAALAAARRGCEVVATDYVPAMLDRARERAAADRLPMTLHPADAEALPFQEAEFDAVLSTFGVMFTADPLCAVSELLRVCRPNGRIGLANWTPEGFTGRVFDAIGMHARPLLGTRSPALWGTRERIADLFRTAATSIEFVERSFTFRYRSTQHWLNVYRTCHGPLLKAFEALLPHECIELEKHLLSVAASFNRARDGTMVVPSDYLEVVITRA